MFVTIKENDSILVAVGGKNNKGLNHKKAAVAEYPFAELILSYEWKHCMQLILSVKCEPVHNHYYGFIFLFDAWV